MPSTNPAIDDANAHVLTSVESQIRDLQPNLDKQVETAEILAELNRLDSFITDPALKLLLVNGGKGIIDKVKDIQSNDKAGKARLSDFGEVLSDLYSFEPLLLSNLQQRLKDGLITKAIRDNVESILLGIIIDVRQILSYRPDVGAILDDLKAIKNLRGGPADATAFHDFHVLQMAFRSVWMHAFDDHLKAAAAELYKETVRVYKDANLVVPPLDAIEDVNQLANFLQTVKTTLGKSSDADAIPPEVMQTFPTVIGVWNLFSFTQRWLIHIAAKFIQDPDAPQDQKDHYNRVITETVIADPQGPAGRLSQLVLQIGRAINEPYAFDVFAPDSFNYGLMITYRQKWEPGEYQAGDLAATIPLAPGETRKYSKRRVVKTSRAVKEVERSVSSRSLQSSETSRAESEIIQKTVTATNFKMTAHGSFNIGIGSIDSTTEFGTNQDQLSSLNKKAFHEATIKAAEEYRLERSLEVDTTSSVETEETSSGEISNPNNEITVTYLFYELQRRYKISEFLYRVRPVILIAQDVPAPHEINEAWLVQYQWIIARVLLDESLRPALEYLTSGFAGDEVSIEVIKAHWEAEMSLSKKLEAQVQSQLVMRDSLREQLVQSAIQKSLADASKLTTGQKVFTLDLFPDPAEREAARQEANRNAAETRIEYVEQALADAQEKLRQSTSAFEQATKEYAAAIKNQFARHIAIDQLRVHVKQNILYYMQAIWDHEPTDQRFFRLYNKKVICPKPDPLCSPDITVFSGTPTTGKINLEFKRICVPGFGPGGGVGDVEHQLIDVADIDNPLGYKGNYMIFPLKDQCYLTMYMLTEFIGKDLDLRDPDGSDDFDVETFDREFNEAIIREDRARQEELKRDLIKYITAVRRSTDEIIVPTGQLFIEALPGSHPLLEDFKLLHRFEDVRKVRAEVRHAELENLRLASRLVAGQEDTGLLEDPDIEKKIIVEGNGSVVIDTN
jgi:hypothetical protein